MKLDKKRFIGFVHQTCFHFADKSTLTGKAKLHQKNIYSICWSNLFPFLMAMVSAFWPWLLVVVTLAPLSIRGQCYKTFYGRNLQKARLLVLDNPFQPSLMFLVRQGEYTPFRSSTLG
jgi:hypothetical protein